jgi:hypothetical protein
MIRFSAPMRPRSTAPSSGADPSHHYVYFASGSATWPQGEGRLKAYSINMSANSSSQHDVLIKDTYKELELALAELNEPEDEDWKVEESVYRHSIQIAAALMHMAIPRPGVFTHGPNSIVFNWTQSHDNLYLTITDDKLYVLMSSPQEIKFRAELGTALITDTNVFLSALGSVQLSTPPSLSYHKSDTTTG